MDSICRKSNSTKFACFTTMSCRPLWMFAFAMLPLSLLTGCTTSGLFSRFSHQEKTPKATPNNPVVRCLCLWEPGEGTGVDDKPARGVVGQIFLFTRDSVSSVAADGDVRIFTFDDQGTEDEQSIPLHQFEFLNNSFQTYLRPTQFGPAYQLFIPYSRKGRHQAELAIRVRLSQPGAPAVFSELTKVTLVGHERPLQKSKTKIQTEELPQGNGGEYVPTHETDPVSSNLIEESFQKMREQRLVSERNSYANVTRKANERSPKPARIQMRRNLPRDNDPAEDDREEVDHELSVTANDY